MVENVPPKQVWEALQENPNAQLVDVRTDVGMEFVGVPDLVSAGKQAVLIPWQTYPAMQRNPNFTEQLTAGRASRRSTNLFHLPQRRAQPTRRRRRRRRPAIPHAYSMSRTGSRAGRCGSAIAASSPAGRRAACPGGSASLQSCRVQSSAGKAPRPDDSGRLPAGKPEPVCLTRWPDK